MGKANAAATEADGVGQQIQDALSVTATPQVNNAQLAETLRLGERDQGGLGRYWWVDPVVDQIAISGNEPQLH